MPAACVPPHAPRCITPRIRRTTTPSCAAVDQLLVCALPPPLAHIPPRPRPCVPGVVAAVRRKVWQRLVGTRRRRRRLGLVGASRLCADALPMVCGGAVRAARSERATTVAAAATVAMVVAWRRVACRCTRLSSAVCTRLCSLRLAARLLLPTSTAPPHATTMLPWFASACHDRACMHACRYDQQLREAFKKHRNALRLTATRRWPRLVRR